MKDSKQFGCIIICMVLAMGCLVYVIEQFYIPILIILGIGVLGYLVYLLYKYVFNRKVDFYVNNVSKLLKKLQELNSEYENILKYKSSDLIAKNDCGDYDRYIYNYIKSEKYWLDIKSTFERVDKKYNEYEEKYYSLIGYSVKKQDFTSEKFFNAVSDKELERYKSQKILLEMPTLVFSFSSSDYDKIKKIELKYEDILNYIKKVKESFVIEESVLIKKLDDLNNSYAKRLSALKIIPYEDVVFCKSKSEFDKFDTDKYLLNIMREYISIFDSMIEKAKKKNQLIEEYFSKYDELENVKAKKVISKEITKNEFLEIENEIYEDRCLVTGDLLVGDVLVNISYSYMSPSFRNSYENKKQYYYNEIKNLLKKSKEPKQLTTAQKRNLVLEEKLNEIKKAKEEFDKATKGHIYSANKARIENEKIEIDANLSLSQKLKMLRMQFDNGEISYEEYQRKRKELM